MPEPIRDKIRHAKQCHKDRKAEKLQFSRFMSWIARDEDSDKARIETRLEFDIHRLEKGLSHQDFRRGFGKSVLREISKRLQRIEQADPNFANNSLYLEALSALHEYQTRHEVAGYDLAPIQTIFPKKIWDAALSYKADAAHKAGSFIMDNSAKAQNLSKGFIDLAEHRYSVREYADTPVAQEILDKVYAAAMKTPSVCNRQATRIHQISNPTIIEKALKIQGGFNGYKTPPVLLFISSDIRAFMNGDERNEPFVDGGLFSMSLLYALEAYGLAACPLNTMFNEENDKATRELLHIPDYELPVMYIAVGNFPESIPVCASIRKNPEEILTIIK